MTPHSDVWWICPLLLWSSQTYFLTSSEKKWLNMYHDCHIHLYGVSMVQKGEVTRSLQIFPACIQKSCGGWTQYESHSHGHSDRHSPTFTCWTENQKEDLMFVQIDAYRLPTSDISSNAHRPRELTVLGRGQKACSHSLFHAFLEEVLLKSDNAWGLHMDPITL